MLSSGKPRGVSLPELLLLTAVLAILAGVTFPVMGAGVQRTRARGAADALAAAIRTARMRAITTGWQYRVVAFDGSGPASNAFRVEGMNPASGGAWPETGATKPPTFHGTNQMYEAYTDLPRDFGGAQLQIPGGGPTFTVTFDSRGQWAAPCVPASCQVQVSLSHGLTTLSVSQAGAVSIMR